MVRTKKLLGWVLLTALFLFTPLVGAYANTCHCKKVKAAWILIGPIGEYGWSYAHDMARRYVDKIFPWLETTSVQMVKEEESPKVMEELIHEGYTVIFATSYGYGPYVLELAKKYPNVLFFHCSGEKRAKNVATYFAELYQLYYLNGLMAGALTKSGIVGYVAAVPIPEVIRHINAFALGVKEANPNAVVKVKWLPSKKWVAEEEAKEATEALIKEGADAIAFTEDTPSVVIAAEECYKKTGKRVYVFANYYPMLSYGPDVVLSGQLARWEVIYVDILSKIYSGYFNSTNLINVDYWWMLQEGAVELGCDFGAPINPKFVPLLKSTYVNHPTFGKISVYDLVMTRLKQMKDRFSFDPFTGPIYDQHGKLRIKAGERASRAQLWTMDWFVDNIVTPCPPIGF